MKSLASLWNFFSSVKLAIFTLCCLAGTSIIGTIIPQNQPTQAYIESYGPKMATFFQLLDITDMYTSWWFLILLGTLSANLIICSIDRFPRAWEQITRDNLQLSRDRIAKLRHAASFTTLETPENVANSLKDLLADKGWKAAQSKRDEAVLLFSQKQRWSRLGVYIVHLSILVVLAGAIYGSVTGFRGSIMLPELESSSVIYPYDKNTTIDLGFTVRCDRFDLEFYDNGMPKEYRSQLSILENDTVVLQKDIEVNDPLRYKGITLYQASYQPFRNFLFTLAKENGTSIQLSGEFQKELQWPEQNVRFGIINLESLRDSVNRIKIWFSDPTGPPTQFWLDAGEQTEIQRGETTYVLSAKQRYATGLQVAKDPGVWVVYLGFGLLILGLYMAFFMSHRRIWLIITQQDAQTNITLRGTTNKSTTGFTVQFNHLAETIEGHLLHQ